MWFIPVSIYLFTVRLTWRTVARQKSETVPCKMHAFRPNAIIFVLLAKQCFWIMQYPGLNVSSYFTIVQTRFSFPLGLLGPLWFIWKWSSAHVYARGRKPYCKLHYCLWKVSIKPKLPFSILNVFSVSKGNLINFCWKHQLYIFPIIGLCFLLFVLQDKPNQKIDYWDSGYAFLHIFFSVLFKYN